MKVFISYRREDSAGHTGRLYDSLRSRFGENSLFLDLSGIDSGQKFADVIQAALRDCDVLLAVIGPEWLTCTSGGGRRIDAPTDLVRTEITTALQGGIPVVPVLVGGASPPAAAALPVPLKPLAALDAHEMSDERWAYDVDRLVDAIERLARTRVHGDRQRRRFALGAVTAAAIVLLGGLLFWNAREPAPAFDGEWTAEVAYEWGARVTEHMVFTVEAGAVSGTASFLGVPRRIAGGTADGDRITFETRSQEVAGNWDQPHDVVHRYDGRIAGDEIGFTMASEGGASQAAVRFTATRTPGASK